MSFSVTWQIVKTLITFFTVEDAIEITEELELIGNFILIAKEVGMKFSLHPESIKVLKFLFLIIALTINFLVESERGANIV